MDPLTMIGCLDDEEIDPLAAALDLAAADRATGGETAADCAHRQVEALAARLAACAAAARGSDARARALTDLLAHAEGFTGDDHHYDAPENADLIAVLERRRGLPIALAILHVGLARRVGWPARILGLPGHVLVAIGAEVTPALLDPFRAGRRVDAVALARLIASATGRPPAASDAQLLDNRASLVRLLMNQASRARQSGDTARALVLHDRLTRIAPGWPALWWERARLERLAGDTRAARLSLANMREVTRDPDLEARIDTAIAALAR